jgi:hypothetical protein
MVNANVKRAPKRRPATRPVVAPRSTDELGAPAPDSTSCSPLLACACGRFGTLSRTFAMCLT